MSKFIQHLGFNAKRNKLTNWRNHLKNYQCVIQFFCFIPANLVFKYDFQHIETWSSTQKSVNKCKYIYNFKKYRSLYFASWHFVSLRSVVFSGWTPRYEGRKTSASNLLLFQWPSKPTLNAITSYCFAAALDSTTLRKRECKKKNTTTTTTNNNNNNKTEKIRLISKTTILLVHHTFFVHFMAVLHAVTTSWKRLISRFGRA